MSITYALASSYLEINGVAQINSYSWNVHFSNLSEGVKVGKIIENKKPQINEKSTVISGYDISFTSINDEISYHFDIVNSGDLDAYISSIVTSKPICTSENNNVEIENDVCNNIEYKLIYDDGQEVAIDDDLLKNEKKGVSLFIKYKGTTLPKEKVEISNMIITIIYSEKR